MRSIRSGRDPQRPASLEQRVAALATIAGALLLGLLGLLMSADPVPAASAARVATQVTAGAVLLTAAWLLRRGVAAMAARGEPVSAPETRGP